MTNRRPWILALTAALALAAGCKKDQPAALAPSSETANQPGVKPGPADPAQAGSGSDWRGRRRNGGPMSDGERAAMMRQRAEALRKRSDTDGDGKLTPAELAAVGSRMRFDDPAAIDTDHDGDISVDELVAALKARAEQRRAQRAGSGGADGTGDGKGSGGGEGSGSRRSCSRGSAARCPGSCSTAARSGSTSGSGATATSPASGSRRTTMAHSGAARPSAAS